MISGRGHLINDKLPRPLLGSAFWESRPKSATLVISLPVRRRTCSPVGGSLRAGPPLGRVLSTSVQEVELILRPRSPAPEFGVRRF